ncbi:MAG TPA: DUF3090 domain-containing protein [Chloroflexi bacterium]|nr:DUF3090 domain-containing protein [Chloroflexota bacterium]HHW86273.1 DUF3090 domain-containing protein [Chloroflexota bacterium]
MTQFKYDLNPVDSIVADAIGEPGHRTFFLQGRMGRQLVSVTLEKQEVNNLAISMLQLLAELEEKYPDLAPAMRPNRAPHVETIFEPAFRVAQLIIGYDEEEDMIWLIAKALVTDADGAIIDPEDERVPAARFVATRSQMRALSEYALEVVAAGRPSCPLCGRPIDRQGHFCPRTDGHAMPIIY